MSKDIYKVYKITNSVNDKVYIGITCRPIMKRFWQHCSKGNALYNSIKKYGKDKFKIEHIATSENRENLGHLESLLIEQYNSMYPNGYNLTSGGEMTWKVSEHTKELLRNKIAWNKGKRGLYTDEIRKSMGKQNIGNTYAAKNYTITTPKGEIIETYNLTKFCEEHNLDISNMSAVANGRRKHHKNYKISYK